VPTVIDSKAHIYIYVCMHMYMFTYSLKRAPSSAVKCLWGVRLGVWGVVLVVCACVSVSGVLFSVGVFV